jgi:transposase
MMEPLHWCVAGLDVHKESVVACVRRLDDRGRAHEQVRTFGTMTADLLALGDWLAAAGATHAAMESTGVYWKPVWHLLDGRIELLLVNAQHIKQVPGRKTDVKDCAWIAQLLQHGLLKASLVPPQPQQELRELTRQRAQLVGEQARVANRVQKVLEDANVKLASVATDVLGVSGRAMLRALIAGQTDPAAMAELARGRLRTKLPALEQALLGRVTDHHRFLLKLHLEHYEQLEALVGRLGERIEDHLAPFAEALELLVTIPGVQRRTAEVLLAEIGTDVKAFPTSEHLASWAGLCPGNNQSAGKRRTGKTRKGSPWLRTALVQAAWAASRAKDTYLAAHFRRLSARRGRKRAAGAVAHTLLVVVYHVLSRGQAYQDLGADYLDRLQPDRLANRLVRRLERLGLKVTVEPQTAA